MKETTEENTSSNFFTMVPPTWSRREDVPLEKRVIVAYIYTRANIETKDWELVAANIVNMWGLAKSTVSTVMKELERCGVIHFTGWKRNGGDFPSKMFRIDRAALEKFMSPPPEPVHQANRYGSSCEPPRFKRRTATVSVANLEEERKEDADKKIKKEERLPELVSSFPLSAQSPAKTLTVSGTPPEPLEKTTLFISGESAQTTPATDTERRPTDSTPTSGQNILSASLTVPDPLAKRIRIAEACREIEKWKGRKPELVAKYFDELFAR
jgi:hypothetical protein